MELCDIGMCLETGHLYVGGGDPARLAREWSGRINHVHVKDAHRAVIDAIVKAGEPHTAIWSREAFCALGSGDVTSGVFSMPWSPTVCGWLVVEQDIFPQTSERFAKQSRTNGLIAGFLLPMASEPFRLGLVGAGRMGATHLRALAGSTETPVVAVAEPVRATARSCGGHICVWRLTSRSASYSTPEVSTGL